MKKIINPSKIFIKSDNSYQKIINKYNISLIIYLLLSIIINIIIGNKNLSLSLIKYSIISFIITSIISYIVNVIKKEYNILKIYKEDSIISISVILSFFGINTNVYIFILSILITLIIKNTIKKIDISSVLYGILIILIYKYFNNELVIISNNDILNYLFSILYQVPLLSIIAFIYIFHNKSIKYNIVLTYIITFSISILLYNIFKELNIYNGLIHLLTSSILFLSVYTISDYKITPNISEGNIIYGLIMGIISFILYTFIGIIGIILTLILSPLILTNIIDKLSPKLKYNNKLYIGTIISLVIINSIVLILSIVFIK